MYFVDHHAPTWDARLPQHQSTVRRPEGSLLALTPAYAHLVRSGNHLMRKSMCQQNSYVSPRYTCISHTSLSSNLASWKCFCELTLYRASWPSLACDTIRISYSILDKLEKTQVEQWITKAQDKLSKHPLYRNLYKNNCFNIAHN